MPVADGSYDTSVTNRSTLGNRSVQRHCLPGCVSLSLSLPQNDSNAAAFEHEIETNYFQSENRELTHCWSSCYGSTHWESLNGVSSAQRTGQAAR